MSIQSELQATIADLVVKGKGILAADESHPDHGQTFYSDQCRLNRRKPPRLSFIHYC